MKQKQPSDLERELLWQVQALGLPVPVTEYVFATPRRWRFDLAWPDRRIACEVEGGTWVAGRHTTGTGFAADCAKYNEAALRDWRILRVTGAHIKSGQALDWIAQILGRDLQF